MAGTAPILELRAVSKLFAAGLFRRGGGVRAVDCVDLRLSPGEAVGLVGESGCGKTTLARCALFLLEPSSGSVFFDGIDLASLDTASLRRKRRDFQIVFQDPYSVIDPRMTVRRALLEPLEIHESGGRSWKESRLRELLGSVSLDASLLERYPADLSGGQAQRVVIARALALKPRLIIADEPVAALDPSVQAQVLNLLADLRRKFGLTLLLISHSAPVVRHLCGRVAVMYMGRIVEEAPAEVLFSEPRHPYSQLLLSSVPGSTTAGRVQPAGAEAIADAGPAGGCAFYPRCRAAMTVCERQVPSLAERAEGEKVACFLYT